MTHTQAIQSNSYRELFEEAPVAYHELDAAGIVRRVNHAECELLGYTEAEMVGRPIWEFVAGAERDESKAAIARKFSGEEPLAPFRRQYFTRGEGRITVEIHERLIRDDRGVAVGMRTALLNVSDQVVAEEALRNSQCWLSGVLQSLPDAVIAVDPLGAVKFMNAAAVSLTGWEEVEAQGKDIEEVLVLNPASTPDHQSVLVKLLWSSLGSRASIQSTVVGRAGNHRRVCVTPAPILADQNAVIGATVFLRLIDGTETG